MKIFELNKVSYSYLGKYPALEKVSLEISEGEQAVILGANGSGKSTLLQILDGLVFPDSGTIKAFGTELSEEVLGFNESEFAKYFRSKVALVFQNSDAQLFNSTVYDEAAFAPAQLNLPSGEIERRVKDVLALVGIEKLGDRAPFMLSGGEKRKVTIASALSQNPAVLLLDEPTANLDPRTKNWLIELLEELRGAGKTIISSMHDIEVAKKIGERAIVLSEDHRIVFDGKLGEALENRELLISANLIHEHVHKHEGLVHAHEHAHLKEEHKHRH